MDIILLKAELVVNELYKQQESPAALTRKRHTDRGVTSPRYAVLAGGGGGPTLVGGGYLPWWGGYLPWWGGTYPGGGEVPTLVGGVPTWWGGTYLGRYPPPRR